MFNTLDRIDLLIGYSGTLIPFDSSHILYRM